MSDNYFLIKDKTSNNKNVTTFIFISLVWLLFGRYLGFLSYLNKRDLFIEQTVKFYSLEDQEEVRASCVEYVELYVQLIANYTTHSYIYSDLVILIILFILLRRLNLIFQIKHNTKDTYSVKSQLFIFFLYNLIFGIIIYVYFVAANTLWTDIIQIHHIKLQTIKSNTKLKLTDFSAIISSFLESDYFLSKKKPHDYKFHNFISESVRLLDPIYNNIFIYKKVVIQPLITIFCYFTLFWLYFIGYLPFLKKSLTYYNPFLLNKVKAKDRLSETDIMEMKQLLDAFEKYIVIQINKLFFIIIIMIFFSFWHCGPISIIGLPFNYTITDPINSLSYTEFLKVQYLHPTTQILIRNQWLYFLILVVILYRFLSKYYKND